MPSRQPRTAGAFLVAAAVCASVSSMTSTAFGQDAPAPFDPMALSLEAPLAPPRDPEGLLQSQSRRAGAGGMYDQYGLKLSGYVEAGYVKNFANTPQGTNGRGRLFDDKSDDPKLHQLSLTLEREALSGPRFDTGFKLQVIYGADARYTQANGTNFYGSGYAGQRNVTLLDFNDGTPSPFVDEISFPGQEFPENQIDVLQAYATFNVPMGDKALLVTAGKFVAPWGIEHIDPTQNALYSHSYIFTFLSPRTLTGVTAGYEINEQWGAMAGVVLGWDQALEDNNDMVSLLGQLKYKYSEDWTFVFTGMVGPEQEDNRSDTRWLFDITGEWKVDEYSVVGFQAALAYEPDVGSTRERPQGNPNFNRFLAVNGEDAAWFGVAGYYSYKWDSEGRFVSHVRGEYFNDTSGGVLLATEVFSLTGGMTIRPWPEHDIGRNLAIRPEIRYDYANDEIFDGTGRKTQWTAGADIVFSF